jgi:hypothetical protein
MPRTRSIRASLVVAFASLALAGCNDATTPADVGTITDGGGGDAGRGPCHADADCSDGVFCNGVEHCALDGGGGDAGGADARGCVHASAPACTAMQTCDEAHMRCTTTCTDADGDGHGAMSCGGDDCDDTDPHDYPGNAEVCVYDATTMMRVTPTHDEDCNPMTFSSMASSDGDHDGDHYVDVSCLNRDQNGNTFRGNDCADLAPVMPRAPFTVPVAAASVHPTATELCNGVDDDCNGVIDDGLTVNTYYPDCDGDGFGSSTSAGVPGCDPAQLPPCMGHQPVQNHTDCNDAANTVHMGAAEICDGLDNDCNGTIDDAAPAAAYCTTMFPTTPHATVACTAGACTLTCAATYGNCDGTLANGCETLTTTSAANCGMCGHACGPGAACTASTCEGLSTIDAGAGHTCALYASSGHAVCWGHNNEGQLGDGSRTDRPSPVAVAPPLGGSVQSFMFIDAGGLRTETATTTADTSHTCAATTTAFYCWGRGNEGQLGDSSNASSNAPVIVATLPYVGGTDTGPPAIYGISAGGLFSYSNQHNPHMAMPQYHRYMWGLNTASVFGVATPAMSSTPVATGSTTGGPSIAAGPTHACWASDTNGAMICSGTSTYGEAPSSMTFPGGNWAQEIAAGGIVGTGTTTWPTSGSFTCVTALPAAGTTGPVYCMGANSEGQLGNGGTAGAAVVGLTAITDSLRVHHGIAAGGRHACAVTSTNTVVCWGDNHYGQLGNNTTTGSNRPVTVMGITNAIAVAAGGEHSCAVLMDGTARCWGHNDYGQLGDGTTMDRHLPVHVLGF